MKKTSEHRDQLRLLKFISNAGNANVQVFGEKGEGRLLITSIVNKKQAQICLATTLDSLKKFGLVKDSNEQLKLTSTGHLHLLREQVSESEGVQDKFQAQHRVTCKESIKMNGDRHTVVVNRAESPLMRLKSKAMPDGSPWISDAQFVAGERLRADFTKAQLMPNVTSNWNFSAGCSGKKRNAVRFELSDSAIDARQRVESAREYVGSELAGLLIDVCCFLKGLEIVEKEQQWPARSAKLMLRTGLDLLARRYGLEPMRK